MEIYRNFIGGAWVVSGGAGRVANVNPADVGDVIGETPLSTAAEALAAAEAAAGAYRSWRRTAAGVRGAMVARAARLMAERAEEIAAALTREQGKLLREARAEVRSAVELVELAASQGRRPVHENLLSPLPESLAYVVRQPLGVAVLFSSWLRPAADPAGQLAAALAAGNSVVLVPSLATPATAELVARCFADAGAPAGVLNVVHGAASDLAPPLVGQVAVRAVALGEDIAEARRAAVERGVPVWRAGGGANPALVLDDADLDRALAGVLAGAFGEAGQRRAATGRVILMHPVADAFLEKLVGALAALRLGPGAAEGAEMGPLASEARLRVVLDYVAEARAEGAELLCGGGREHEGGLARGLFVAPAVLDRCRPEMRAACAGVLGPVLAVTRVESFEEALAAAAPAAGCLSAAIYTRDAARIFRFVDEIEVADVRVNARALGEEVRDGTLLDFFGEAKGVTVEY
ncbi:MAG: hypothetical protein RLZZ387_5583 [Chloroflexota bacterium]